MTRRTVPIPSYGPGKNLERYAELTRWYEMHLEQIADQYENDAHRQIARNALAERNSIMARGLAEL